MKKYFWILLCSLAATLTVETVYFVFFDRLHVVEFLLIFLCSCIPLFLILGLSILIGRSLSQTTIDKKVTLPKFSFNFQISLSITYIVFLAHFFFQYLPTNFTAKVEDYNEQNIQTLSHFDEDERQKYLMAYNTLKQVLRMNAQNSSDTNVCLERTLSQSFDTVINGNRMNTKIVLTMGVAGKDDGTFRYLFCCNDSVGFQICSYPFPKINATTNN